METMTQFAPEGVPMSEAIDLFRRNYDSDSVEPVEHAIARGREYVKAGLALCESPIEQQVLPWLVFANYGAMPRPVRVGTGHQDMAKGQSDIVIVPQFPFHPYRLDFAVYAVRFDGARKMVAVECDGFAFHDVRRDAERDAYLLEYGVETIRGSGSDVFRTPYLVAERVVRRFFVWSYPLDRSGNFLGAPQ